MFTVFMLVKTNPEWLGFPVAKRFDELARHLQPILDRHKAVNFTWYDTEFYTARVTDVQRLADRVSAVFVPAVLAIVPITALVMAVTGMVAQKCAGGKEHKNG